jgi:hypothetical protein
MSINWSNLNRGCSLMYDSIQCPTKAISINGEGMIIIHEEKFSNRNN